MAFEITLRYIHFISIFFIVGTLVSEHLLLKKSITRREIGRLAKIDAVFGIAAATLLTAGLTLWLSGAGKPSFFYTKNWVFLLKISLFAVIGILSIRPTVFFLRNRKGNADEVVEVPARIFMALRIELLLLLIIPLLAGLMSKGIGFAG